MKRPKVSVIMPIYNVEKYISRCLTSVVNQTLLDIEIICVNDGTKDNSVEVVKQYMATDKRIQLIEKENGGIASARNAGLDNATGDLIIFVDPDDFLDVTACEVVYRNYISYYADVIVFGSTPFPEIPKPDDWVIWKLNCHNKLYKPFQPEILFDEPCGMPFVWNKAFARGYLIDNKIRFDENIPFGEDIIFLFTGLPLAGKVQFIRNKLHYYQCYRPGSLMYKYGEKINRKLSQHIENVAVISYYWYKNGLLEKWGDKYFAWVMEFIVPDLMQYDIDAKRMLSRKMVEIIDVNNLLQYAGKMNSQTKRKYKMLKKMAEK